MPTEVKNLELSIIVPCYNEISTIGQVLAQLLELDFKKEIIVVDDGSSDGTKRFLKEGDFSSEIRTVFHKENKGKGAAISTALDYVSGDYIVIQDADLEYEPRDLTRMLKKMKREDLKVLYGSRFLAHKKPTGMSLSNFLGNKVLTLTANLFFQAGISDEATCYKMFKAEVLENMKLQAEGFDFCPEVTAKVNKKGLEIFEVPIDYSARTVEKGKKIQFKDGLKALLTLLKFRLWK